MKFTFLFSGLIVLCCSCGTSTTESTTSEVASDTTTTVTDTTTGTTVTNSPNNSATSPASAPFSKEVSFSDFKFTVVSDGNTFTLTPSGYSASNDPFSQNFEGNVADVIIDDIDGDNNPEVAVLTRNGADSIGKAYVYSSNGNKSMSMVNLPEENQSDLAAAGYQGRDEFDFVEGSFVRRFPKFKNGAATGKYHQIQYKLKPGEASKQLVQYKAIDY